MSEEIASALTHLPYEKKFTIFYLDQLSDTEKNMIFQRNVFGEDTSPKKTKIIAASEDKEMVVFFNQDDHLKITSIKSGLALTEAWEQLNEVDSLLENSVNYSVSNEYGYLTSFIGNIGTGMKASMLVHLPGLVMTSLLSEMFKILSEKGLSTRLYGSTDDETESSIYEIYNYFTIGTTEDEIIQILNELSGSLINLERKMRGIIYEKKRKKLEDKVYRSLGILKYSRSITKNEALKLLSLVRLGISLNIVNEYSLEQVTSLIMSAYMNITENKSEKSLSSKEEVQPYDYLRAQTIRDILIM
jgi:protein arginine kinase